MLQEPVISVVIPTFQRRDALEWVLPSLLKQSVDPSTYEILLCDAGSSDGTKELVEELNDSRIRFSPGENRGRSGARNRGILEARGSLILFTDADILADEQLIACHLERHRQNPGQAVVGCEIQVNTLEEYDRYRVSPEKHARHKPTRQFLPWHYFLTGNASVSKEMLVEVGRFDEGFIGYGHEDLELGYRLLKRGLKIYYAPEAINYHWHPVPLDEQCKKMRLAGRSTVRFYRKHRDLRVPLQMGMNPISLTVHALIPEGGRIHRWLVANAPTNKLAREILLQHFYVTGIKEAWSQPSTEFK